MRINRLFFGIGLTALFFALASVWPVAQCALARNCTERRDLWCNNGRPGKCCEYASGFEVVYMCSQVGNVCNEVTKTVPVRCTNPGNCQVTQVLDPDYADRLVKGVWYVGSCPHYYPVNGSCGVPNTSTSPHPATCCGGRSTGGGGEKPPCQPQFAPPVVLDGFKSDPPYPLPWGQEQPPYGQALGVTISDIRAQGGQDVACGSGQSASISSLSVALELQPDSISWIDSLRLKYPGARVKGTYPQSPERPEFSHPAYACSFNPFSGLNTPAAELDCQFFRVLDPGNYNVVVTACQSDGKCTTRTLPIPLTVWLMESSLGK